MSWQHSLWARAHFLFEPRCSTSLPNRTGWSCGIRIRRCHCESAKTLQAGDPWSVKEGTICAHAPASALEQIVAIRVHLDDSNAENGALKILPGTHSSGVLSDDAIHELAARTPAVECCVKAGGVLLMRPLVVHASSKTRSGAPRRVLHIEYASRTCFGGLELAVA